MHYVVTTTCHFNIDVLSGRLPALTWATLKICDFALSSGRGPSVFWIMISLWNFSHSWPSVRTCLRHWFGSPWSPICLGYLSRSWNISPLLPSVSRNSTLSEWFGRLSFLRFSSRIIIFSFNRFDCWFLLTVYFDTYTRAYNFIYKIIRVRWELV